MRTSLALLLTCAALAPAPLAQSYVIKSSPCTATAGHRFGESAVILDYNGDAVADLAIGASGEDVVYLFFGPTLTTWMAITPSGPLAPGTCSTAPAGTTFGASLAAASLDANSGDELLVGATGGAGGTGEVRIYGRTFSAPAVLSSSFGQVGSDFGYRMVAGDFDGDTSIDLAVGAPKSIPPGHGCASPYAVGRVHLFYGGLLGASVQEEVIENPQLGDISQDGCNGFFGVDVAAADGDADGLIDLYASAEGNGFAGLADAGSVSFFRNPVVVGGVAQPATTTIGDTNPQSCNPGTRYGKSIDARGAGLAVGSPIKSSVGDSCATPFVGGAFLYTGPSFGGLQLNGMPPQPPTSRLGYRVALVNRIGGPEPDVVGKSMGTNQLYVWDGANPSAAPVVVTGPSSTSIHWWIGTARGQLVAGGFEELVMGDPEFNAHTGRVAIWR